MLKLYKLFKIFLGKIEVKFRAFLSEKLYLAVEKPESVYLNISNKCNFRCKMCDQWEMGKTEDVTKYLTMKQLKSFIDQLAKWGVKSFGISGGETLLWKNKVLELVEYANKKKMYTHFVTNGFLINREVIEKYDKVGGGHISMSLDAASTLHDTLRGVGGAYEGVLRAIKTFKKVNPKNILLKINLVVTDRNLDEILSVVEICRKNSLSLFMQPFDPYNWDDRKTITLDQCRARYPLWVSKKNEKKLQEVVNELLRIKRAEPSLILNSIPHLKALPKYFKLKINRPFCSFAYRTLSISPKGDIMLCRYGNMGNIKELPIRDIWWSKKYRKTRRMSAKCNYDCLLGCMYDPSIYSWFRAGLHFAKKEIFKKK